MIDISKYESESKSFFAHMNAVEKDVKSKKAQMTECMGLIKSSAKQVNKALSDLNDYLNELNVNIVINEVDELDKLNDIEVSKEALVELSSMVRYIKDYNDKLNNGIAIHDELYKSSTDYKVKEADAEEEFVIDLDNINNELDSASNELERVIDVHPANQELVDKAKAFKDFGVEDKYTIKTGESLFDIIKNNYEMQDFSLYKDELLAVCRKVYLDNQDVIDAAIVLNNLDKEELLKSNKLFTNKFALNGISIKLPDVIEYDSLVYKGRSR